MQSSPILKPSPAHLSNAERMRTFGDAVMERTRGFLAVAILLAAMSAAANADDAILSGTITSSAGEKLGGVTVSAKPAGGTVPPPAFTDASGEYPFPPLPAGKYRVWAQAISFETAKAEIDLTAARKQAFALKSTSDFVKQLPGNAMLAALPEET